MTDLLALVIALAIVFGLMMRYGVRREKKLNSEELYNDLLRKCAGDKDTVERLIEGERKRHPQADRDTLIKHAIERWQQQRK